MTDRELMQMVLEELEELADVGYGSKTVLEALRERLSQPEPEPVAWFTEDHREDKSATTYSKKMAERWREKGWPVTPLYTAPPKREWVGLTDEDRSNLLTQHHGWNEFGQAIEAKLKEKNT